jgi:hypothetical protein
MAISEILIFLWHILKAFAKGTKFQFFLKAFAQSLKGLKFYKGFALCANTGLQQFWRFRQSKGSIGDGNSDLTCSERLQLFSFPIDHCCG